MGDGAAVALAGATAAGAWVARPLPVAALILAGALALARRRPVLVVVVGALAASWLGARSVAGLDPVEPAAFHGVVVLLADPTVTPYGARADVRVGERRIELQAGGAAAGSVLASLAGERLAVQGRLRPPPPNAPWLVPRHVVGRLVVARAERAGAGGVVWRAANRVRRLIDRGAEPLGRSRQAQYRALVLGDDRDLPPEVVDDFRGAGLTHVMVVSGQNLAFVLVLVAPLARRLRLAARFALTLAVIGGFLVLTRLEPSVLRAGAMAAVAATATLAGRPTPTVRRLALAVTALVLVDPLLVRSIGFQLSVLAAAGIAVGAAPIAARLRGPAVVRDALGVTIAAQLGVAPVLVPAFGGLPVVSLVTNPVAVPVAGLVTTWGLPAGLVAGVVGGRLAHAVHRPTGWLVDWVAGVARVGAAAPLGELDGRALVVLVGAGALAGWALHRPAWMAPTDRPGARLRRPLGRAAVVVVVVTLLAPAAALRHPPDRAEAAPGVTVRRGRSGTEVELRGRPPTDRVMEGLRRAGVRRIDVLLVDREAAPALLAALRHRWAVGTVVIEADGGRDAAGPPDSAPGGGG